MVTDYSDQSLQPNALLPTNTLKAQIGYRGKCLRCGTYYFEQFRVHVETALTQHVKRCTHRTPREDDFIVQRLSAEEWNDYVEHKSDPAWWYRLRNKNVPFDTLLERGGIPIPKVRPRPKLERTLSLF